jgi:hypothetical protein
MKPLRNGARGEKFENLPRRVHIAGDELRNFICQHGSFLSKCVWTAKLTLKRKLKKQKKKEKKKIEKNHTRL